MESANPENYDVKVVSKLTQTINVNESAQNKREAKATDESNVKVVDQPIQVEKELIEEATRTSYKLLIDTSELLKSVHKLQDDNNKNQFQLTFAEWVNAYESTFFKSLGKNKSEFIRKLNKERENAINELNETIKNKEKKIQTNIELNKAFERSALFRNIILNSRNDINEPKYPFHLRMVQFYNQDSEFYFTCNGVRLRRNESVHMDISLLEDQDIIEDLNKFRRADSTDKVLRFYQIVRILKPNFDAIITQLENEIKQEEKKSKTN